MKLSRKLKKEQFVKYCLICEYTWGCVPVEIDWAIETKIYKAMELKLIEQDLIDKDVCLDL